MQRNLTDDEKISYVIIGICIGLMVGIVIGVSLDTITMVNELNL